MNETIYVTKMLCNNGKEYFFKNAKATTGFKVDTIVYYKKKKFFIDGIVYEVDENDNSTTITTTYIVEDIKEL